MLGLSKNKIFNLSGYTRRTTIEVPIGGVAIGGDNPIRVQTMTTTNTNSVPETVEQSIKAIEAGAEYIRVTTQGVKEAQSLGLIKKELRIRGYNTPIIADIHFNPAAAIEATKHADKIRINPGNFADKSRSSAAFLSEEEYEDDLARTEARFLELLEECKRNSVAIRVGVNHGSLSHRIMNRYGDTPEGMAYSAIEFLRICRKHSFHRVIVSMKSSNTRVMVQATRFLVRLMEEEGMSYPLHLGVTEAGEGEDGRIRSAVGIGALLVDGIGDTIRVSLTEEPENEIPVAKALVDLFSGWQNVPTPAPKSISVNPFEFRRRESSPLLNIGGDNVPVVIANLSEDLGPVVENLESWGWSYNGVTEKWQSADNAADYIFIGDRSTHELPHSNELPLIGRDSTCKHRLFDQSILLEKNSIDQQLPYFVKLDNKNLNSDLLANLKLYPKAILIVSTIDPSGFYSLRNLFFDLMHHQILNPVIIDMGKPSARKENFQISTAAIAGPFFLDGLGDGLMITAPSSITQSFIRNTSFGILQASRVRISKTEFISCPGCGRTLFNLNQTLQKVKERTSHLKGLKIGVMGCIVNGPGEMADSDYGYVGAGPGRVSLYRKKEVVKKNIPEVEAVQELINLIKANGDWKEND